MNTLHSQGWNDFVVLCQRAKTTELFNELCSLLLSLEEQQQLALRVELIKELLKEEKTQR